MGELSEYRVLNSGWGYEVYRLKDDGEPMNSGNIFVESTWNTRGAAEVRANMLNETAALDKELEETIEEDDLK